jgi:D-alanyl-D-alanine carboxypeptidase
MKRIIKTLIVMLFVTIAIFPLTPKNRVYAKTNSSSEIVMEVNSNRILYKNNAREKKYMASTTKILTAIIIIENCNLNDVVTVTKETVGVEGSSIYLEVGEKITVVDLLYGLILRSGNDSAVVLAKYIAGNEDKFVELMNKKAKEIGMLDTEFQNSHGLDEKNRNISTAYDMALLSIYAYNNDTYKKISGTKIYKTNTNKKSYAWYNRNNLLSTYQYCTSGKNGYTPSAGKTLVTTASKNGMDLTIVTLNVYDSYSVHRKLYEKYYETYEMIEIIKKGEYFIPNDYYDGKLKIVKSFYYPLTKQEKENVKTELYISKEKLNYYLNERYSTIPLLERIDEISDKIAEQTFRGNKSKAKQVRKWLKERINISLDMKEIYRNFFTSKEFENAYPYQISEAYLRKLDEKTISFEDACLFVYMKSLLQFLGNDYQIEQTIIDEAQDYNKLQYILLKKILKKSKFTILGDINQTINPYYEYKSLEDLKEVFEGSNYLELTKTYRSSPEIIEHANKILNLNLVSAIRRDTKIPVIFRNKDNYKEQMIYDIETLQKKCKSIAIITKTDTEAIDIYKKLKPSFEELTLITSGSKNFNRKLIVIPSYMSKGLEFDASIIYTEKDNKYKPEEKYLYYVSCTRSQHYLVIYNQN